MRILREGGWAGIGQAGLALFGLATTRVLTELMPAEAFGHYALTLGLVALAAGLFGTPLLQAMLRAIPDARLNGAIPALRAEVARMLARRWAAAAVLILCGAASAWLAGVLPSSALPVLCAAPLLLMAELIRSYDTNLLNADRAQARAALRLVLDALGRFTGAVAAAGALVPHAAAAVSGLAAGSLAVSAGSRRFPAIGPARVHGGPFDTARFRPGLLDYARPLVPVALFAWLTALGDRYVLGLTVGAGAAGLYAAAYGIASQPFSAANLVIVSTLRPLLFDAAAAGNRTRERFVFLRWLALAAGVSAAGALIARLCAGPIARLALGEDYRGGAVPLIPVIASAYAVQNVQQAFETLLLAHAKTGRLAMLQGVGAALSVALYAALIPWWGLAGAAYATLASFVLSGLLTAGASLPLLAGGGDHQ